LPLGGDRIIAGHGAIWATVDGELSGAFYGFGVWGLDVDIKVDFAHVHGHAGAGGVEFAAGGELHGPSTFIFGIAEGVFAQVFFFHAGLVGVGNGLGKPGDYVGHGDQPLAGFDVERFKGGG